MTTKSRTRVRSANASVALLALLLALAPAGLRPPLAAAEPEALPGTRPLVAGDDLADEMVAGIDRFLLDQTAKAKEGRAAHWRRDVSSAAAYAASVEPNRRRLARLLGVRDARPEPAGFELVGTVERPDLLATSRKFSVFAVRWAAFGDVHGEGLLLEPADRIGLADVVVVPDADQLPEQLAGLVPGLPEGSQVARRLAEAGCRVVVPTLVDRTVAPRNGRARLTNREYVYRPSFELGRHPLGFEVQKVLAAVDNLARRAGPGADRAFGVFGYGEGGAVAFYAAAVDPRIKAAGVSGFIGDREATWTHPLDRNVFGLLERFGDAEVASLIAPRALVVEAAAGPEFAYAPKQGGGPGRLTPAAPEAVRSEVERAAGLVAGLAPMPTFVAVPGPADGGFGSIRALGSFLTTLAPGLMPPAGPLGELQPFGTIDPARLKARQGRQVYELDRHTQQLLVESAYVRDKYFAKLDTKSPEAFARTIEPYREYFEREVIGRFDLEPLAADPRSRKLYETPKLVAYEVVLDVFPDVLAAGILVLPKDLKAGERRPVVVCQHGLEGRPRDVADPKVNNPAYNQYALRLAERGFITFAPQNPYIFEDRFRTLQRKANPLGKTLFSVIVPQHRQITAWLKTLPQVDPARIAFYGLSYGGKSAMRIPPLVPDYCLSICSADFDEWVWKIASTRTPYSYVWTGEYEIFEFDLGSTFNYAEMAALIAPRPFMVERGHFDGVAPDEAVGYEFAKVYHLYNARLGLGDRCAIEYFVGPHTINGKGTFDFLHKHLNWPKPE